jgi:minimal CRISPR polymerase domain
VSEEIFIYFDGDDIGPGLEILLLDGLLDEASLYSRRIAEGIRELECEVVSLPGARIIVSGGDDLVATCPAESFDIGLIDELRKRFESITSRTVSVGVGRSPKRAVDNLHRAKLLGRDRIVSTVGEMR